VCVYWDGEEKCYAQHGLTGWGIGGRCGYGSSSSSSSGGGGSEEDDEEDEEDDDDDGVGAEHDSTSPVLEKEAPDVQVQLDQEAQPEPEPESRAEELALRTAQEARRAKARLWAEKRRSERALALTTADSGPGQ